MSVDQSAYLEKLIESYYEYGIRKADTPATPNQPLKPPVESEVKSDFPYSSLVGSLLWMTKTRPDIAFAVSQCARYNSNHTTYHNTAALQVLGYLAKNPSLGLVYKKNCHEKSTIPIHLGIYADASWADDISNRCSSFGYTTMFFDSPISWRSKKMSDVATSSAEAEYIAYFEAGKEAFFLTNLLADMNLKFESPIPIHGDSVTAISMVRNDKYSHRTKHIDIRYHLVCQYHVSKILEMNKVNSKDNTADIFTKPLPAAMYNVHRDSLVRAIKSENH